MFTSFAFVWILTAVYCNFVYLYSAALFRYSFSSMGGENKAQIQVYIVIVLAYTFLNVASVACSAASQGSCQ